MRAALFLCLTSACTAGPVPKDETTDDSTEPGCRSGLNATSADGFSWVDLTVDGLAQLPQPDAACVSSDGLEFEHTFSVDETIGRMIVAVSDAGAWGVPSPELLGLRVELGEAVWNAPDFYSGSVSAGVNGANAEGSLEAEATSDSGQITLNLVWSAPLP